MIHGNASTFAVEAVAEGYVGVSVAGRIRVFVGGCEYGKFGEPSCVLGSVAAHLTSLTKSHHRWSDRISKLGATERFRLLDDMFFTGNAELDDRLSDAGFLTHVSEAFDPIKGFAVRPNAGTVQFLIQRDLEAAIEEHQIPVHDVATAADSFSRWINERDPKRDA